jgi:hypothetical protein
VLLGARENEKESVVRVRNEKESAEIVLIASMHSALATSVSVSASRKLYESVRM